MRSTPIAAMLVAMATLGLAGCASTLSGFGGQDRYACQAPAGTQCTSVSGVYANTQSSPLAVPGDREAQRGKASAEPRQQGRDDTPPGHAAFGSVVRSGGDALASGATEAAAAYRGRSDQGNPGVPVERTPPWTRTSAGAAVKAAASSNPPNAPALRTSPRVLRLWIAPWEDRDGDLHDASTVHVLVDPGRWRVERIRPAPRVFRRVAAPAAVPLDPGSASGTASPGSADSTGSATPRTDAFGPVSPLRDPPQRAVGDATQEP